MTNKFKWFIVNKINKNKKCISFSYNKHPHAFNFQNQKLTHIFPIYPTKLTSRHRYETHNNYKMMLKQIEVNQVTMRNDIDYIQ